jgi:hypothetical protein
MGRILELYRLSDAMIDKIHKDPVWAESYITNNYASVSGALHQQNDTVFSIDKAWDVARYLIQKYLVSKGSSYPIFGEHHHDELFNDEFLAIKSPQVQEINALLQEMQPEQLNAFYNKPEIAELCYQGDWVEHLDDYVLRHIATIKEAYQKAAAHEEGLVVRTG